MKKKLSNKKIIFTSIGFLLSAYFIYLCLRSISWDDLRLLLHPQFPTLILAVVLLNLPLMALRTLIGQILIQTPPKKIRFRHLWELQHIGFLLNTFFPLKAGDFVRASLSSKKWHIPYFNVLTSVGLERYFAGLSLCLLLLALTLNTNLPPWLKTSTWVLSFCLLLIQIALVILWSHQIDLEKWKKKHRYLDKIAQQIFHIRESSTRLKSPGNFLALVFLSLATWWIQAWMLLLLEKSYQFQLSWQSNFLVLAAVNLAIVLPSAPGNIGTFEFAAMLAFELLGIPRKQGFAVGTSFHLLQTLPVAGLGLFHAFASGWRWRKSDTSEKSVTTKIAK